MMYEEPTKKEPTKNPTPISNNNSSKEVNFNVPGFYVFGANRISDDQVKSIRMTNPLKVTGPIGRDIPVSNIIQLFRISGNDSRPLFLNSPLNDQLQQLTNLFLEVRPEFMGRIFHISFEANKVKVTKLKACEEVEPLKSSFFRSSINEFFTILQHEPRFGEVYWGRITHTDNIENDQRLIFVNILPNISAILYPKTFEQASENTPFNYSDACGSHSPEIASLKTGDKILVKVSYSKFTKGADAIYRAFASPLQSDDKNRVHQLDEIQVVPAQADEQPIFSSKTLNIDFFKSIGS